jgi:hypothetical protein
MDLKEKLVSSFMAFEERVDVHSDLNRTGRGGLAQRTRTLNQGFRGLLRGP